MLLDSGAYTDRFALRLSPRAALLRMVEWENRAKRRWGDSFRCRAWVAYDRLIDHSLAVPAAPFLDQTIWACRFFHLSRADIQPRTLVMPLQGTNPDEYEYCARGVLPNCRPDDCIGLGGWCYLGRSKTHLPRFVACLERVLPMIAAVGIRQAHLFGVTWTKALEHFVRLCRPYGLALSTDSSVPLNPRQWNCQPKDFPSPQHAVSWWRRHLAAL